MSRSAKNIIPAGCIQIRDNVLRKENLTGVSENKADWAKGLNLPAKAEYTFFAGCGYQQMKYVEGMMGTLESTRKIGLGMGTAVGMSKAFRKIGVDLTSMTARITASKEDPYTPVLISAVSVLRKLGVDVGYMHESEPCCGSPIYYNGFTQEYAEHAKKNFELFKSLSIDKLIGIVPGCTSALRDVYPRYVEGYDLKVEHILQVIAERVTRLDDKPRVTEQVKVTYHDPCQLSRYLKIIEEPRTIIRSIQGVEFVETDAEQCGKWSSCCGGGGLEAVQPELSERVGTRRIEELVQTGAPIVLTNCPACEMQLRKAARKLSADIRVIDLIEFLDNALVR